MCILSASGLSSIHWILLLCIFLQLVCSDTWVFANRSKLHSFSCTTFGHRPNHWPIPLNLHLQLASVTTNTPADDSIVEQLHTTSCSHKCYLPQPLPGRPGDSAEETQKLLHSHYGLTIGLDTKIYIVVSVMVPAACTETQNSPSPRPATHLYLCRCFKKMKIYRLLVKEVK